jgi:predicted nucleic acid-binding protein
MSSSDLIYVRYRYWDASAAVKLVASELKSDVARAYFESGGPFYITHHCAVEVLSVLKSKHFFRKELSQEEHSHACHSFLAHLRGRLKLYGPEINDASTFWDAEELGRRHALDFIDALQLVTVKTLSGTGPSAPLLITADEKLAAAARLEKLEVWDIVREPVPQ